MKRTSEDAGIPLSALIDIVFLLIIFFVITANMQKQVVDYNIKLAASYFVEPPDEIDPRTFIINVRKQENGPPVYSVNGTDYQLSAVGRLLLRSRERLGETVPVLIRASGDIKYREIDQVNKLIHNAGLYRVRHSTLSHYGEESPE